MTSFKRLFLLVLALIPVALRADEPLGFFPASREAEARAEHRFLETPTPAQARRILAQLTEEPHVAGTPQARKTADYVADRLKSFGLDVETVTYDVFLNHPRHVSLSLVAPVEEKLSLEESAYDVDKDSAGSAVLPAFHGYSASGKATAQVVYANYGMREDFDQLRGLGQSVEGRIVLVRYGRVFRGLKVKEAQDRGAIGVLIYSDPADDGYMKGDVYPDGPMRPPSAVQRGSVQFLSLGPGDPSTPGYASVKGAARVARDKMDGLPRIPSLPIAYGEAEKILRHVGGARVPDDWQGGLPFAYHVGPGLATVTMDVQMDEGIKPIFDVIARIPGTTEPDRLVVLGNHRDAWVHGAVDPNSGTTALLEMARGLAAALKTGWKPRRTILLASWDAEEYGLLGSTEWGEDNAERLTKNAIAYINVDAAVTGGELHISGVPSLRDVIAQVAAEVPEPRKGDSVGADWERRQRAAWSHAPVELAGDRPFATMLEPLGSGSDYTVFLDHLGVPAVDVSFAGPYGVYHSVYDDFRWMTTFGDPEFLYHTTCARLLGLLSMRLASADVAPLRFGSYGDALQTSLDELRRETVRARRKPADAGEKPALDPDFAPVLTALVTLRETGAAVDRATDAIAAAGDTAEAARVNGLLSQVERAFVSREGLPGRPWFRHLLYAPGLTTGYAAWPFPGLAQAVYERDPAMFAAESRRIVDALGVASERLRAIARPPQH